MSEQHAAEMNVKLSVINEASRRNINGKRDIMSRSKSNFKHKSHLEVFDK